jgi:Spy/CpxP family protein refolding chaperone
MRYFFVMGMAIVMASTPAMTQAQAPRLRRAQLERLYRERGEQIVRKRLNLTNPQMQQLRKVNTQFAGRRRALMQQQQSVQLALRDELARNGSADQAHVAQLNGQLEALKRQRFELQQDEQHELSKFLTPVQQAQYQGLQAQLRAKIQAWGEPPREAPGPLAP